jgi:hypothetical protein
MMTELMMSSATAATALAALAAIGARVVVAVWVIVWVVTVRVVEVEVVVDAALVVMVLWSISGVKDDAWVDVHGRSVLYHHGGRWYTKPFVAEGLDTVLGVVVEELLVAVIWAD